MPRIDVPEGRDPLMYLWGEMAPDLTRPAVAFSGAVYDKCSLTLREFEAARTRIAQINDCAVCLSFRSGTDAPRYADDPNAPDDEFYAHVGQSWDGFTERESLAAEFAERFAVDHLGMDDAFWDRMRAAYSDDEVVQLGLCVGNWVAFGRLQRVLGVDACRVPQI